MASTQDRIEKRAHLRASRERVWQALSDSKQFGTWFGMECDAPFVAHTKVTGRIKPTQVDAEIAKHQEPFEGMPVVLFIGAIEPMNMLSFRWHPGADTNPHDADAPTTEVTFRLEDGDDGVWLTIVETGFDQLPPEKRAKAFAENEGGWQAQMDLIAKYLARAT